MLSLLARVIKSPWFWSLVGIVLLCLTIWFLFGAIGFGGVYPFEDPLWRLVAILVVVIIYFAVVIFSMLRSLRANKRMVEELDAAGAAAVADEDAEMTAQELATLRERMRDFSRAEVERRRHAGDRRIEFVDGSSLLGEDYDICTVDGVHPSDLGFQRMGDALALQIRKILSNEGKFINSN